MLSTKLGPHQSSVSHTLKELMEEGLVVKKGKSYSLSNVGIIERNTMEWMRRTLGCLKDHRDFIQSHDLSGIPPRLPGDNRSRLRWPRDHRERSGHT